MRFDRAHSAHISHTATVVGVCEWSVPVRSRCPVFLRPPEPDTAHCLDMYRAQKDVHGPRGEKNPAGGSENEDEDEFEMIGRCGITSSAKHNNNSTVLYIPQITRYMPLM